MLIHRAPAPALHGRVSSYHGISEETGRPVRRREGPGAEIVVILSLELGRRLANAQPSCEVAWAWRRLRGTHGRIAVGALAEELGWSRKRIVARFRDEIGLPPKAAAQLLRFARARELAGTMPWVELAFECGFHDQSHLINEVRAITRTTPETFLQDAAASAA